MLLLFARRALYVDRVLPWSATAKPETWLKLMAAQATEGYYPVFAYGSKAVFRNFRLLFMRTHG